MVSMVDREMSTDCWPRPARKLRILAASLAVHVACYSSLSAGESAENDEASLTIKLLRERIERLERQVELLTAQQRIGQPSPNYKQAEEVTEGEPIPLARPLYEKELAKDRSGLEATLVEKGGLLLTPGSIELEPSLTYSHASSDSIDINGFTVSPVFVVGEITSERVRRNALIPTLAARFGLPWDTQVDVRVPYVRQLERRVTADQQETSRSGAGLGDIEFGISKQLFRQQGSWPDTLVRLTWKTTTGETNLDPAGRLPIGTGFNGVRAGFTFVKSSDPAVLFGSMGFTFNEPRTKAQGRVDPGNTVDLSVGTALALSSQFAISLAWDQRYTTHTQINGVEVPGSTSEAGTLRVGATYAFSRSTAMDFGVGIGLTRDAPDVQATVAFPLRVR
jgi:hypothetical protein